MEITAVTCSLVFSGLRIMLDNNFSLNFLFQGHLSCLTYWCMVAVCLRIGACSACVYQVMDARGKFEEHERSVRVRREQL